jgi:hypothetical protein
MNYGRNIMRRVLLVTGGNKVTRIRNSYQTKSSRPVRERFVLSFQMVEFFGVLVFLTSVYHSSLGIAAAAAAVDVDFPAVAFY